MILKHTRLFKWNYNKNAIEQAYAKTHACALLLFLKRKYTPMFLAFTLLFFFGRLYEMQKFPGQGLSLATSEMMLDPEAAKPHENASDSNRT